jgi:hypothetical protein
MFPVAQFVRIASAVPDPFLISQPDKIAPSPRVMKGVVEVSGARIT